MTVREITVDELEVALAAGAPVIDVRETSEYAAGRVPGARLVPMRTVPDSMDAFRGAEPVYVICHSGGRSMRVCEYLATAGIPAVNVAGGTAAWVASGRAVEVGDSAE